MNKNGKNPQVSEEKQKSRGPGWQQLEDGTWIHKGKQNLVPYKPGESGNPSGRPKDVVKHIAQMIAHKSMGRALSKKERQLAKDMDFDPDDITVLENLMLTLATSRDPAKNMIFLERAFGKVPNINLNAQISESIVTRFRSKLTDAELERIVSGEDALEILLEKLPDVMGGEDYVDAEVEDDEDPV